MKRILIASAVAFAAGGQALAADLPPPMAPPPRAPAMYVPVVPLYNWTGFYLGGNLGFGLTGGNFNSPAHVGFDNHLDIISRWRSGRREL
jgi:outer membrane immunogenic protein